MKNLIFILSIFVITSCCSNGCDKGEINHTEEVMITESAEEVEKPFANPAIIYGSTFGDFFQEMYLLGDYEGMLKFTSSESIELHGEEVIIEHYKNMDFGFELGKLKTVQEDDGRISMFYLSDIDATKVQTILHATIENDSCKMVIHQDIENFPRKVNN